MIARIIMKIIRIDYGLYANHIDIFLPADLLCPAKKRI